MQNEYPTAANGWMANVPPWWTEKVGVGVSLQDVQPRFISNYTPRLSNLRPLLY